MFNHAPNEVLKATVLKCLKKGTMLRSGRTTYLSARPRSRWSSSAACATLTDPSSTPATSVPQSEWVKLEEAFCGHNSAYRPTNGIPTLPQIRKARAEFERRFMQTAGKDCGVPGVLVATHVDRGKWSQKEDFQGCKFLMTASSDLFITQVSSPVRTAAMTFAHRSFLRQLSILDPKDLMYCPQRETRKGREADVVLRPRFSWNDDDDRRSRVVVDIEYTHRGPTDCRQGGFRAMTDSHFHRAYVLLKIYPRDRNSNDFAAAAFMWRQTPIASVLHHIEPASPVGDAVAEQRLAATFASNAALANPIVGMPYFAQAVEFGTVALNREARETLTRPAGPGELPAATLPPFGGPAAAAALQLPGADVFYLCRDKPRNVWFPSAGANDLTLDLGALRDYLAQLDDFDDHDEP